MTHNTAEKQEKTSDYTIEKENGSDPQIHFKGFSNTSYITFEGECISHMAANGFFNVPLPIDITGKTIKFSGREGCKDKTEWYKGSQKENGSLLVTYNSHHDSLKNEHNYVFNSNSIKHVNEIEAKAQKENLIKMQKIRTQEAAAEEKKRKNRAEHDRIRFNNASETGFSKYLERKKVEPHGIRFEQTGTETIILIPMRDENGEIQALQEIFETKREFVGSSKPRDKNFTNSVKGLSHVIGNLVDGNEIRISEGYATSASCYESTGGSIPHVVAFSAGAYRTIIPILRKLYPNSPMLICADNNQRDDPDEENTGIAEAEKAAKGTVRCSVVYPVFLEGKDRNAEGERYADFNDLMIISGKDEVKRRIENAIPPKSRQEEELIKLTKISEEMLRSKNPCEGFSTKKIPKDLDLYISSKQEATEADPIMLTMAILGIISGFLQKRCCLPEGEYFQTLYPNLWMLAINRSGGFKTTALNKGSAIAYKKLDEIKEFTETKMKDHANAKTAEEKLIIDTEISLKLRENALLPNRATSEGLLEHLSQGYSGVITASEFGAWLENLDVKHNAGLKALFTDLYDVPRIYTYKTKTGGLLQIEKPFISICGVSTLDWIKKNIKLDDVSSGFFARFLIFNPPYKEEIPAALPKPKTKHNTEAETRIWETLHNIESNKCFTLSPSAKELFEQFHTGIYKTVYGYGERCKGILEPYLKRWSPYLLKLAMIFRIFEDPLSKEISDTAIASSMALLESAIKSTAFLFEKELGESDHQRKCRKIKEYIAKKGGQVTRRILIKAKVLEGGAKEYDDVLNTLKEGGEIVESPFGEKTYVLNANAD